MKLIATIALSFMLALAGSALAEDYENAVSATRRGDFADAFKLLKPLAEKGDARAQATSARCISQARESPPIPRKR